ncbi:hypothetical protein LCGC14_1354120 [marine sediment metagenome]|uniref:Uncharacterized protein n=1 Tax=marine sediment metagenome TaxID=412755 RepID=A0A0F9MQK8_9ZZZZ
MRLTNNNQSVPIRYENTNIPEGYTKLSNLILFYPFNPQKERSQNMHWLHYDNMPICGVIGECNRKGFPLFSDWFETSREHFTRIQ